jgi:hypothetical protein
MVFLLHVFLPEKKHIEGVLCETTSYGNGLHTFVYQDFYSQRIGVEIVLDIEKYDKTRKFSFLSCFSML